MGMFVANSMVQNLETWINKKVKTIDKSAPDRVLAILHIVVY